MRATRIRAEHYARSPITTLLFFFFFFHRCCRRRCFTRIYCLFMFCRLLLYKRTIRSSIRCFCFSSFCFFFLCHQWVNAQCQLKNYLYVSYMHTPYYWLSVIIIIIDVYLHVALYVHYSFSVEIAQSMQPTVIQDRCCV